jgi:NAD(P)H-dependent flavin oxidoreductase YrpB (nitropropane dioxygenase family)
VDAGADVLIAQGVEAGGHVRGRMTTFSLLTELIPWSPGAPSSPPAVSRRAEVSPRP